MKTILTTIMTLLAGVALAAPTHCSTWAEVSACISTGKDVVLMQDVTVGDGSAANVRFKTATFDLNGKNFYIPSNMRAFTSPGRQGGETYTLTLMDSAGGGKICRPNGDTGSHENSGSFVWVGNGDTFVMESGVIDGLSCGTSTEGAGAVSICGVNGGGTFIMNGGTITNCVAMRNGGGAVFLKHADAVFTMNGGRICGCKATNSEGGGVYVSAGTFTMTGGTICGNEATGTATATGDGGGVCSRGARFTMSGGEISGNTASRYGGGVSKTTGTFTFTGGTIRENQAQWGGGFEADTATVSMSGGSVVSNVATTDGGGVYVWKNSTFTMNGGEISGCTATSNGGGVYNGGTLTVNGGTIKNCTAFCGGALYNSGTTSIYGGTITDNEAKGDAKNSYGGFCYVNNNCSTHIYGGFFSGNTAPAGKCNLLHCYGWQRNGKLHGGVFADDPTARQESGGCLVLQNGAAVNKVGDVYLVGKGVMLTDGKLAGGSYAFNPTERLYKDLGISLAEGCHVTRSGTGYAIVAVRGTALTGLVNEAISFHGFLTAADGTALTENSVVKIDFKLYPTASSEELLWARRIPVTIDQYSGYYVDITDTAGQSYQAPGGVRPTCTTLRAALARHAQLSAGPLWIAYEPVAATVATPFPRVPLYFQPLAQRASSTAQATVVSVSSVETSALDAADASTVTADRLVVDTDLVRLNGLTFDVPHRDIPLNATGAVKLRSVTGLTCSAATNTLGALLADLPATADSDCGRVVKHVVNGVETQTALYYSKGDATTLPEGSTNVYVWSFGPLVEQ